MPAGGAGRGGAQGGEGGQEAAQKEAMEEETRRTVMSQILSPEARERCASPFLLPPSPFLSALGCSFSVLRARLIVLFLGISESDSFGPTGTSSRNRAAFDEDGARRAVARQGQRGTIDWSAGPGAFSLWFLICMRGTIAYGIRILLARWKLMRRGEEEEPARKKVLGRLW